MTDTFTWRVEATSSGAGEFDVSTAKFGDGYAQEVANGLNNETQKWTVIASGYQSYTQEILDFIREHQGAMSFFWKAPNMAAPGYFKCKSYNMQDQGGNFWVLSMEFVQAFAP